MPKNRISKLQDGRWYYSVTDSTGKRRRLVSRKNETKRNFNKRCDQLDLEAEDVAPSITLDQLHLRWLENYAVVHLSKADSKSVADAYRRHVSPYIGNMTLDSISRADVYNVLLRMDEQELSSSYIGIARSSISRAYTWAINALNLDVKNPTQGLIFRPSNQRDSKIRVITDEEMERFFKAAKNCKYLPYFHVLRLTGLRPSEGLGLRLEDNLGDRLCIQRGITIHEHSDLKTQAAKREIPITPPLERVLKQAEFSSKNGWYFPSESGEPSMSAVSSAFKRCKKQTEVWKRGGRNGMKKLELVTPAVDFTLYDFRHTFATIAAEAGMPETALTSIMGHKSINTTLQYYIGLTDNMMNQAITILESMS